MHYTAEAWANGWPAIGVDPVSSEALQAVLARLSTDYTLTGLTIIETLDGAIVDFTLDGCAVRLLLDNWTLSFAFADAATRDRVLAGLQ